jgi:hypothetical protein
MDKTIRLGDTVKDEISGVKGVVIGYYEYVYGCVRCCVQPPGMKDEQPIKSSTFDLDQLKKLKDGNIRNTKPTRFDLGEKVKDSITGFEGVTTGRFTYLHGPTCYGVQPQKLDKDGNKPAESDTFDEGRLERLNKQVVDPPRRATGGPRDEPRRAHRE